MVDQEDYLVLYVAVRKLNSMGNGKAEAHSGHAASSIAHRALTNSTTRTTYLKWCESTPQGFGTQINLDIPYERWAELVEKVAGLNDCLADIITDPTYPILIDSELIKYLKSSIKVVDNSALNKPSLILVKEETSCYFFGLKSVLEPYLEEFHLKK